MEEIVQAIVLGLVQGLTEFLPISSTGHLAILQSLLDWTDPRKNLAFIVAVHFGSLGAVLVFARYEIAAMLTTQRRLLLVLVVATLPAAVLGPLLKPLVEDLATSMVAVGLALLFTAGLLALVRHRPGGVLHNFKLPLPRALLVGFAQALALFPGVSRSGSTLAVGLYCNLDREQAVRFSFLMAAPAIFGAGLYVLVRGEFEGSHSASVLLAGTFVSFVASLFAMKIMVGIVVRERLGWFALYCLAAGAFALVLGL